MPAQTEAPQAAADEPFALARRGLPLITRNATPLRAPWLPPQLCSRAQALMPRMALPPAAAPLQDAEDPQWLQPLGVFPKTVGGEHGEALPAPRDEPWWMEAAEWVPADAPPAAAQSSAVQTALPQSPAARFDDTPMAARPPVAAPEINALVHTAVPEAVHAPMASAALAQSAASATQPPSEVPSRPQPALAAQEAPVTPVSDSRAGSTPALRVAAASPLERQAEPGGARREVHIERIIERAPWPVPGVAARSESPRAQTNKVQAARAPAGVEPAVSVQRMGGLAQPGVSADQGQSAGLDQQRRSDRQAQLAQMAAHAQPPGAAPRIHIDHVQVTVDMLARPVDQAAAAGATAPVAPAPSAPPAAMAVPARGYASAWSTYFARAD